MTPTSRFPSKLRITQISDEILTPSFYIRFRDPVAWLTSNWNYVRSNDRLCSELVQTAGLLVAQRAFTADSQIAVGCAKRKGVPVVYEADDFFLALPPQSGLVLSEEHKQSIRYMLSEADLVTCSTSVLADAFCQFNQNVQVIENYAIPFSAEAVHAARSPTPHLALVNTDYFKLSETKTEFFSALRTAIRHYGYRVTFLGTIDPVMDALRAAFPSQVDVVPCFIPWRRVFLEQLLLRKINVAAIPLDVSREHRFKSDVKFFDFASLGVAGIFNNRDVYKRVVHRQNGFLCGETYDSWLDALAFFSEAETRSACGDAAYELALSRTLQHYTEELGQVYTALLQGFDGADLFRSCSPASGCHVRLGWRLL